VVHYLVIQLSDFCDDLSESHVEKGGLQKYSGPFFMLKSKGSSGVYKNICLKHTACLLVSAFS
jgi:hypothetical protein